MTTDNKMKTRKYRSRFVLIELLIRLTEGDEVKRKKIFDSFINRINKTCAKIRLCVRARYMNSERKRLGISSREFIMAREELRSSINADLKILEFFNDKTRI